MTQLGCASKDQRPPNEWAHTVPVGGTGMGGRMYKIRKTKAVESGKTKCQERTFMFNVGKTSLGWFEGEVGTKAEEDQGKKIIVVEQYWQPTAATFKDHLVLRPRNLRRPGFDAYYVATEMATRFLVLRGVKWKQAKGSMISEGMD